MPSVPSQTPRAGQSRNRVLSAATPIRAVVRRAVARATSIDLVPARTGAPRARPRSVLLCPGPVMLSSHVKQAVLDTTIGHREEEFSTLLRETVAMLRPVVGLTPADAYRIAFITGSGTAANEAFLGSVGAVGSVLVLTNGEFGERLLATARRHNRDVGELRFPWQEAIDLDVVAAELSRRRYDLVVVAHHETSSGMLNPVAALAELAHRQGALIAVDAISSIGAERIEVGEWGIDVLTGSSGKALSAMPGIGIVVIRESVLAGSTSNPEGPQYLNLHNHFAAMRDLAQTPNTPAVHVFVSLHAALEERGRTGETQARAAIGARASSARYALRRMGLEHAYYPGLTSNVLTCVWLPEGLSFRQLAAELKAGGFVVYNGKGVARRPHLPGRTHRCACAATTRVTRWPGSRRSSFVTAPGRRRPSPCSRRWNNRAVSLPDRPTRQSVVEPNYFSNWGDLWYPRLANLLLPSASRITALTPNHVTLGSFALFGLAAALVLLGGGWSYVAAALLPLSYVLDCLDGQLARFTGRSSAIGDYLDKTLDVLKIFVINAAMAIAAFHLTDESVFLLLGLVSCFGFLFRYYIKLETMFAAVGRDGDYLEKSRVRRQELYLELDARRRAPKDVRRQLAWLWFRNRSLLALDEAEHLTLGAVAVASHRPDLWVWVFAVGQPVIALLRLVQRGAQLARRPESLTYPLRK